MRTLLVVTFGIAWLAGCSAPAASDELENASAPIVGGQPTPACAFPSTVNWFAGSSSCTGTLVHPKVVTIAAHCLGETPKEVVLGDNLNQPARHVPVQSCFQKGGQAAGEDFAYCILSQEVTDVPIIPILFGCETQIMKPGATAVLVGFGFIDMNTQPPNLQKRWVTVQVDRVTQKTVDLGDATHGACFGDSGGPAFIKLPDGTWRVFGATSGGSGCASATTYAYTPYYVSWIEQQSGIDITPCYDADGTWNPGPGCTKFPMNPEVTNGAWANGCSANAMLSGPSVACGGVTDAAMPPPPPADASADVRSDGRGVDGSGGRADASTADGAGSGGSVGRDDGGGGAGGTTGAGGSSGGSVGSTGGGGSTSSTTTSTATSTTTSTSTTGSAGAGGAGGSGGSNGSSGSTAMPPPPPSTGDSSGCSCRLDAAGNPRTEWSAPLTAVLAAIAASRRRRRASKRS